MGSSPNRMSHRGGQLLAIRQGRQLAEGPHAYNHRLPLTELVLPAEAHGVTRWPPSAGLCESKPAEETHADHPFPSAGSAALLLAKPVRSAVGGGILRGSLPLGGRHWYTPVKLAGTIQTPCF